MRRPLIRRGALPTLAELVDAALVVAIGLAAFAIGAFIGA